MYARGSSCVKDTGVCEYTGVSVLVLFSFHCQYQLITKHKPLNMSEDVAKDKGNGKVLYPCKFE